MLKLIGDQKAAHCREVAVPERLLYIEVIVVSIRTRVLGRFIACGCFALWRWSLMEVPLYVLLQSLMTQNLSKPNTMLAPFSRNEVLR